MPPHLTSLVLSFPGDSSEHSTFHSPPHTTHRPSGIPRRPATVRNCHLHEHTPTTRRHMESCQHRGAAGRTEQGVTQPHKSRRKQGAFLISFQVWIHADDRSRSSHCSPLPHVGRTDVPVSVILEPETKKPNKLRRKQKLIYGFNCSNQ